MEEKKDRSEIKLYRKLNEKDKQDITELIYNLIDEGHTNLQISYFLREEYGVEIDDRHIFFSRRKKKLSEKTEDELARAIEEGVSYFTLDDKFCNAHNKQLEYKVPVYKQKSPSQRHSGIRPIALSILHIIARADRIANKMGIAFIGLSLYDLQKTLGCGNVSNHTVRDNLRKLVKMGLVEKIYIKKGNVTAHYTIGKWVDPCFSGIFVRYNRKNNTLFSFQCPRYPFCTLKQDDCQVLYYLERMRTDINDAVMDLQVQGMEIKRDFLENILDAFGKSDWKFCKFTDEKVMKDKFTDIIDFSSSAKKISNVAQEEKKEDVRPWKDLDADEKIEIKKKIKSLRTTVPQKTYKEIKSKIRKEDGVSITDWLIRDANAEIRDESEEAKQKTLDLKRKQRIKRSQKRKMVVKRKRKCRIPDDLSEDEISRMIQMKKQGDLNAKIGKRFSLSTADVGYVLKREMTDYDEYKCGRKVEVKKKVNESQIPFDLSEKDIKKIRELVEYGGTESTIATAYLLDDEEVEVLMKWLKENEDAVS